MKILLDPGHGINTPGKRSPDGRFLEYRFNREVSRLIISDLLDRGFDCETIVPEETDISLQERCARVNRHCRQLGINNVILVSIHANASGNGKEWTSPSGWSVYTSIGNTRTDLLATHLADAARKHIPNMIIRSDCSDGDIDFEESFYILRHTPHSQCASEPSQPPAIRYLKNFVMCLKIFKKNSIFDTFSTVLLIGYRFRAVFFWLDSSRRTMVHDVVVIAEVGLGRECGKRHRKAFTKALCSGLSVI